METMDKLKQIVMEEMSVGQDDDLKDDDELLLSGRIDSLGVVRLIAMIEEEFNVHVPPEDVIIENFSTLRSIADYLEQRLAVASQQANGR